MNKAFLSKKISALSDDAFVEIFIHVVSILKRRGVATPQQLIRLEELKDTTRPYHVKAA